MPPGRSERDDERALGTAGRATEPLPNVRRSEAVIARFAPPPSTVLPRALGLAPVAVPAMVLAWLSISAIYEKLGHPGAALDDSFIHFQYARAIAEGHPFRYEPGEPATMGATSALWPLMLAPFYALGCTGLSILWPAWILSFVALGLLARETYLLTRPLAGEHAAAGAGAMVFGFSPFTWCAGSGMEVVPFAFLLVRAARRSSEWIESPTKHARDEWELLGLAVATPLFRPEGALASLVIAAALLIAPRSVGTTGPKANARRLLGGVALAGAITPQLLSRIVTGSFRSNTTQVKLLLANPYYAGPALRSAVDENVHKLIHVLLNGEVWSAEFIPHGSMPFAFAGLGCIAWCTWQRRVWFRGATTLLLALAIAVPCVYVSFLWNRLRYLWPFAPFWLVGLACLAHVVGDTLARIRPGWRVTTPLLAGLIAGLFGAKLEGTIDDLAISASGIDRQQVALGKWAKSSVPAGARIGVNDTGAIAYFGDHPTFDIVGLTTQDEARYWVGGAASRFEHYETVWRTEPNRLPGYFIVYPEWMAMNAVLGPRLHEATVLDSTILGGQTMVAYLADYSLLGSGERPWSKSGRPSEDLFDPLDVADLESERAHGYALLGGDDTEEIVTRAPTGESALALDAVIASDTYVADGGRRERSRDSFHLTAASGGRSATDGIGIVRLEASEITRVHVSVDGKELDSFVVDTGRWVESTFALQDARIGALVELVPDAGRLTTYHYWFVPRGDAAAP